MNKKSQIQYFIIIALVIVAGSLIYYSRAAKETENTIKVRVISSDFQSSKEVISFFIENCLKETVIKAKEEIGIDDSLAIEDYIKTNLVDTCINSNMVTMAEQGFEFEVMKDKLVSVVEIADKSILVDLTLPVKYRQDDAEVQIDRFKYYFTISDSGMVVTNGDGVVAEEMHFVTDDRSFELVFPKGIALKDAVTGAAMVNPEIKIEMIDNDDAGIIGTTRYKVTPDMVIEDGEVHIYFSVPDDGTPEDNSIIYIKNGLGWAVETQFDESTGRYFAEPTHLSEWGLHGSCKAGAEGSAYITFKLDELDTTWHEFEITIGEGDGEGLTCIQSAEIEYLYAGETQFRFQVEGAKKGVETERDGYGDCFTPMGTTDYRTKKQKLSGQFGEEAEIMKKGKNIIRVKKTGSGTPLAGHKGFFMVLRMEGTFDKCDKDNGPVIWSDAEGTDCFVDTFSVKEYLGTDGVKKQIEDVLDNSVEPDEEGMANSCFCPRIDFDSSGLDEFPEGQSCGIDLVEYNIGECFKGNVGGILERPIDPELNGWDIYHVNACHMPEECGWEQENPSCAPGTDSKGRIVYSFKEETGEFFAGSSDGDYKCRLKSPRELKNLARHSDDIFDSIKNIFADFWEKIKELKIVPRAHYNTELWRTADKYCSDMYKITGENLDNEFRNTQEIMCCPRAVCFGDGCHLLFTNAEGLPKITPKIPGDITSQPGDVPHNTGCNADTPEGTYIYIGDVCMGCFSPDGENYGWITEIPMDPPKALECDPGPSIECNEDKAKDPNPYESVSPAAGEVICYRCDTVDIDPGYAWWYEEDTSKCTGEPGVWKPASMVCEKEGQLIQVTDEGTDKCWKCEQIWIDINQGQTDPKPGGFNVKPTNSGCNAQGTCTKIEHLDTTSQDGAFTCRYIKGVGGEAKYGWTTQGTVNNNGENQGSEKFECVQTGITDVTLCAKPWSSETNLCGQEITLLAYGDGLVENQDYEIGLYNTGIWGGIVDILSKSASTTSLKAPLAPNAPMNKYVEIKYLYNYNAFEIGKIELAFKFAKKGEKFTNELLIINKIDNCDT
ncbi:MAG: hypothetical protein KKF44_04940 [Nanoarchaeota archaeon]|nr:hypothetical protein [Nanoarchaeota archaeon]